MVGGEEWQEKVYDREEWKRLLRTARNHHILYMPMDWLIDWYKDGCQWRGNVTLTATNKRYLVIPINMTTWVTHLPFTATTDDTFTRGRNGYSSDALSVCVVNLVDETPSLWRERSDFSIVPASTHKELPAVSASVADERITSLVSQQIKFNNCPTRCDLFSLLYFCKQLYMFRVLTPIIRSSYSCNYSFWYWLTGSTTIRSRCWVPTQQQEWMVADPVNQYQKL